MTKILFACYDRDDISIVTPILPFLAKDNIEIAFLDKLFNPPHAKQRAHHTVLNEEPSKDPEDRQKALFEIMHGVLNEAEIERLFGLENFAALVANNFPHYQIALHYSEYRESVSHLLFDWKPNLTVICPGETESEIIINECRKHSLSYCFMLPQFYEFKSTDYFAVTDNTTPWLVSGRYGEERLQRKGASVSQIIQSGNPRYDQLFALREKLKAAKLKSTVNPVNPANSENSENPENPEKNILLALQGLPGELPLADFLAHYIKSYDSLRLTIRPHPQTSPATLSEYAALLNNRIEIDKNPEIVETLFDTEVMVTLFSLSILESLLMAVPAICFKTDYFPCQIPFSEVDSAVLQADNFQQLRHQLDRLLFDQTYKQDTISKLDQARDYYLGPNDGVSSQRVANTLRQLAAK